MSSIASGIPWCCIGASHVQAADKPFVCPLDEDNAFLGKPVYDVQDSVTPEAREAEIDGKKVMLYRSTSLQVAKDGSILLFWSQNETGFIYAKRS